jgi:hypothetical protein
MASQNFSTWGSEAWDDWSGFYPTKSGHVEVVLCGLKVLVHHTKVFLCLSIPMFFTGCQPTLGYRPELPTTFEEIPACDSLPNNDARGPCKEYYNILKWSEGVIQAYTRKAQVNEWSVYAAGAVGIIGGAVVGTLTATDQGNTDAAKITPPITAAVAALLALNQSDDKATAYGESIIAIEESKGAAERHVSRNKTKVGFEQGTYTLKDSVHQEIVNLDNRMVAIRKKMAASIPTTTGLVPQSFAQAAANQPLVLTIFTKNLEADPQSISVIMLPDTTATVTEAKSDRVTVTLASPPCQDYLVMLSFKNKLVLPARNLQCEK